VVTALIGGIGEELGWRGFLQPALERRWGPFKGTVAVGLIWAYWHLPANLMGYNDARHPLLNAFLFFPIAVVAMSFGFAWLTRKSGSAWPAAFAHGANNTIGSAFLMTPESWSADAATELLAVLLVSAVFVRASLQRRPRGPELTGAPAAVSA
jgi:membrane protease YdiL (CAAX protease family)